MKETTIKKQRMFDGRLLKLDVLEVRVGGRASRREIVRHPGAVAIWLEAPDGRLVLVRQYRKALERNLLEVVAGTRERGESAAACAKREIREETGYRVDKVIALGRIFTAPGFCNERIDMFYARAKQPAGRHQPDQDEQIAIRHLTHAQFERLMKRGMIHDAKTLAAWSLMRMHGQGTQGKL